MLIKTKGENMDNMVKYITKQSPTLMIEDAQEWCGGYVQMIKLKDGRKILVDEDARIKTPRPPINKEASDVVNKSGTFTLMIDVLGKAIVLEKGVRKGGW
jgi:phosphosulfolactate synthase (CoM biosynthesis protein A)